MNIRKRMMRGIAVVFCFVLCCSALGQHCAYGAEEAERKKLKVGFFAFDGYHMMDEEGNRSGYGYDFLRLVSRYIDVEYEYIGYDQGWEDMLELLRNGQIDLVTSAQMTEARLEEFAFSKPIGSSSAMLTVASDNQEVTSGAYETYDGMRIGVLGENSRNVNLKYFANEKGFIYEEVHYDTAEALEDGLKTGKIDAALTSSLRRTDNERVLDVFDTHDFYVIVRKEDTELLEQINYAIDQLNAVEGDWENDLTNLYYEHENEKKLVFTAQELAILEEYKNHEKKLVVSACTDKKPYAYTENGEMKGILVDYFKKVAEYVGVPYTFVIPEDREEYMEWCMSGEVANVFLDGRFENLQQVEDQGNAVTAPYTTMRLAMVTRRDFDGEINVLAVSNSQGIFGIEDGLAPGAQRIVVDSREDAMQEVLDGHADATFVYRYTAQQFVNHDERGLLTYTMLEEPSYDYHIVFASSVNRQLSGIFTKAIYAMPNGTIENIASQYTSYRAEKVDLATWIKIHPIPTLAVGSVALLVFFLVITLFERQKAVKREKQRSQQLRELADLAESANHAKTMFLNNMSHDIRTPMNAIIGFTSLAASHLDNTERVKEYLQKISVSSEHLLSLINDVLDMSRIESGRVKIEEQPLHLPDLLHDIRTIVQPTITAKQLNFVIDTEDVRDEEIVGDKLRLNQMLLNILSNGVKFNKVGGMLSLRIRQLPKALAGYASYEFVIRDTGIGMSPEFVEHIFDAFSREETAAVSGIPGTGLGMAITKHIVDMMGGTITVDSKVGTGTEFTVSLTFRLSGEPATYERIEQLQGLRVLVADDDTDTCLHVSKMLTDIGMRPEWTASGKEVVVHAKYAYENGDEFSVYIIDWLMPDMNGIETVRRIRRVIGDGKPIIILTAYDWADVEAEAREAGVTAFCQKPLFMSELRDLLSQPFQQEKVKKETSVNFSGKRVLLVEDNVLNQEVAMTILKELGMVVETAEDGSVAIEKMKQATPGQYDLILMDIQMPLVDGYEATRQIRALDSQKKMPTPIIAMTANAFSTDQDQAVYFGMNGYLTKPIHIKKMTELFQEVLNSNKE